MRQVLWRARCPCHSVERLERQGLNGTYFCLCWFESDLANMICWLTDSGGLRQIPPNARLCGRHAAMIGLVMSDHPVK